MKYCKKCGNELLDEAVICPKCGCSTGYEAVSDEKASIGWIILAILSPIAGVIYALINWKNKPNAAKTVLIVSVVVWIVGIIIGMIISGSMQSAMLAQ